MGEGRSGDGAGTEEVQDRTGGGGRSGARRRGDKEQRQVTAGSGRRGDKRRGKATRKATSVPDTRPQTGNRYHKRSYRAEMRCVLGSAAYNALLE